MTTYTAHPDAGTLSPPTLVERAAELGPQLANAERHDRDGTFVADSYESCTRRASCAPRSPSSWVATAPPSPS